MADAPTANAYAAALVADLAAAIEAVLGDTVTVTPATVLEIPESWRLSLTAAGELEGPILAAIDRAGCELLARRMVGLDDAPEASVVADMLREMWAQATSAVSLKTPFKGIAIAVGAIDSGMGRGNLGLYDLRLGDEVIARVAIAGDLTTPASSPMPWAATSGSADDLSRNPKLEIVLDIDLPLVVRFGRTVMSVKSLAALGPGSIVDMGRSPDEPVQLVIGDQVIAWGEVVTVGGNYGVRITDLASPADRMRAVES
jgi:flagellar motor switch protein FliN/FliY